MPWPQHPHQRRQTRPRPLGRTFARSRNVVDFMAKVDTCVAAGQLTRAAPGATLPLPPTLTAGPSRGAGEEQFVASPLMLSPTLSVDMPVWPKESERPATLARPHGSTLTPTQPTKPRADQVTIMPTSVVATTPIAPTPGASTPVATVPVKLQAAAPIMQAHSLRYPAPQPHIAVGRFPSPPQGRGEKRPATTPPSMPALSPGSPMETATTGPTYATTAAIASTPRPTNAASTHATAASTSASAATPAPTDAKTKARYPPLIVEFLPDWPRHFRALSDLLGHNPNGRPFGQGVRFLPKTEQEFRITQRYLTQLEATDRISWFCYSLPAERSVKVAIRGLSVNTEPAQVEEELRRLEFIPEHVRTIPARPGRPGCLMFAQLQRTSDLTPRIFELF